MMETWDFDFELEIIDLSDFLTYLEKFLVMNETLTFHSSWRFQRIRFKTFPEFETHSISTSWHGYHLFVYCYWHYHLYTRLQHIIYITRSTYTNYHHQRESDTPYLANTRVKNPLLQLFRCLYDFPYWLWLMLFDETESFQRPRDFEVKRGQIVERLCVIKSIWAMHLKETSWEYSSDKLF